MSDKSSIQSILQKKPFEFDVDGLLFYHREGHYTPGHTPIVLWLKSYMLPEILDISIPEWVKSKTPSDYKGYKDMIDQSNIQQKKIDSYLESSFIEEDVTQKKSSGEKLSFSETNEYVGYKFNGTDDAFITISNFESLNKEDALNTMSEQ